MSGHTPGPWAVELPEPGMLCRQDTYVRANQWGSVALCSIDFSLPNCVEQQKANALLIAAAPELLDALVLARRLLMLSTVASLPELNQMDAAIAKATNQQGNNHD